MTKKLPDTGYLRLPQIVGQSEITEKEAARNRETGKGPKRPRPAITPLIPVSRATWWAGVKSGRFPPGIKLAGGRITVWRAEDISAYLEQHSQHAA